MRADNSAPLAGCLRKFCQLSLIQEAVARMLAHNAWVGEQVQIGIDQIAPGEFIEEDEMDARIKRMLES